jgi:hypothetical protein
MTQVTDAPVGQWSGTVSYGPKTERFTVSFQDNGTATLTTAQTAGNGTWSATGPDTFEFTLTEFFDKADPDSERHVTGVDHIVIGIAARRTGSTFAGTGTAEVYGADNSPIVTIPVDINAQQEPAPGGTDDN